MARARMEWITLVHRLRVQDPWLKVLQQEQVVAVQEQPVLLQEQPVLVHCTTQTVVFAYRRSVP